MANFIFAFNKVIKAEGGYVNDPDDRGGETYMGISRKAHPKSIIWKFIDEIKSKYKGKTIKGLNAKLTADDRIQMVVKGIYKKNYWDKFELDAAPSQKLAEQIFDDCVNRGIGATTKSLKKLFNIDSNSTITKNLIKKIHSYGMV